MKDLTKAKLIVDVKSEKGQNGLTAFAVKDNRTGEDKPESYITERGIETFQNIADLKETLNWNLGGDEKKYVFMWQHTGKASYGRAYIFD